MREAAARAHIYLYIELRTLSNYCKKFRNKSGPNCRPPEEGKRTFDFFLFHSISCSSAKERVDERNRKSERHLRAAPRAHLRTSVSYGGDSLANLISDVDAPNSSLARRIYTLRAMASYWNFPAEPFVCSVSWGWRYRWARKPTALSCSVNALLLFFGRPNASKQRRVIS